jgi:hypothetical protein
MTDQQHTNLLREAAKLREEVDKSTRAKATAEGRAEEILRGLQKEGASSAEEAKQLISRLRKENDADAKRGSELLADFKRDFGNAKEMKR